jgi:hypothetical protein
MVCGMLAMRWPGAQRCSRIQLRLGIQGVRSGPVELMGDVGPPHGPSPSDHEVLAKPRCLRLVWTFGKTILEILCRNVYLRINTRSCFWGTVLECATLDDGDVLGGSSCPSKARGTRRGSNGGWNRFKRFLRGREGV